MISIIALLIGILLPALGAARGAAQDVKCLSNNRQLGLASTLYATDNKDFYVQYKPRFFSSGYPDARAQGGLWWAAKLVETGYLPGPEAFDCPSFDPEYSQAAISNGFQLENATAEFDNVSEMVQNLGAPNWAFVEYGMNSSNIGTLQRECGFDEDCFTPARQVPGTSAVVPGGNPPTQRQSSIATPSTMYYFMDSYDARPGNSNGVTGAAFVWDYFNWSDFGPHARHGGGSAVNITYADGHSAAKSIKGDPQEVNGSAEMYSEDNLTDATRDDPTFWTRDNQPVEGVQ